jgi:F-type H+-transporting ATPase subunit epsilon
MKIEIITPKENLYKGEATVVSFPGTEGSFEILTNHAPVISTLAQGEIMIVDTENNKHKFTVKSGLVEASNNIIWVLAEL